MTKKYVVLSGCNGQLGKAIAKQFNSNSWNVCGLDIDTDSKNQDLYRYKSGSVTDRNDWHDLFIDGLSSAEIGSHICLVNNAGISIFSAPEERTLEEFENIMATNLYGPICGITEFYKFCNSANLINKKTTLSIINICSIYGHISPNSSIYTDTARNSSEVYGASKAGLIQLTKYFAVKYAKFSIAVNGISPGGVLNKNLQGDDFIERYSKLVPQQRLCLDTELSQGVYGMVQMPSYMTGQIILLDGGMTAW